MVELQLYVAAKAGSGALISESAITMPDIFIFIPLIEHVGDARQFVQ